MPHVNFLEQPKKGLFKFELNYLIVLAVSAGTLLLFLTYGIIQKMRLAEVNEELTIMTYHVDLLTSETSGIMGGPASQPNNEDEDETDDNFRNLLDYPIKWSVILSKIADIAPTNVWFQDLSGTHAARKLDIEGESLNMVSILRFKEKIEQQKTCTKVDLISSELSKDKAGKMTYHLACHIK